jgi:prepilin-type N-terminal cleavage/methylation domain-containing protein
MKHTQQNKKNGFTLIETMVAISLLMMALVPPMSLASQSLVSAYYSRNQITAFYLAQEGIEVVRSVRDGNILAEAESGTNTNVFAGIPSGTTAATAPPFTADSLQSAANALHECDPNGCPPLQTNGSIYGYATGCEPTGSASWSTNDCGTGYSGWVDSTYTRTIKAYLINASDPNEMRVTVTVSWQQGSFKETAFTINEDLYAWIES